MVVTRKAKAPKKLKVKAKRQGPAFWTELMKLLREVSTEYGQLHNNLRILEYRIDLLLREKLERDGNLVRERQAWQDEITRLRTSKDRIEIVKGAEI